MYLNISIFFQYSQYIHKIHSGGGTAPPGPEAPVPGRPMAPSGPYLMKSLGDFRVAINTWLHFLMPQSNHVLVFCRMYATYVKHYQNLFNYVGPCVKREKQNLNIIRCLMVVSNFQFLNCCVFDDIYF